MEGGNSCSGIDSTSQGPYNRCFKDKAISPETLLKFMAKRVDNFPPCFVFCFFHAKIFRFEF